MADKELNGIYDGYSFMPFYTSHSTANCFEHLYDFEPAPKNHWVPNYGLLSEFYFKQSIKHNLSAGKNYSSFKKNHGPPHTYFNKQFDPLEANEFLLDRKVDVEKLRLQHQKVPQIN